MHNQENITFLALLSLFFFAMAWTPTRFKATFKAFRVSKGGGLICHRYNLEISNNFKKLPKLANLIAKNA